LISIAAGYFYTGGPKPIAYTPYGELVAGFFMGFVIIAISYFIQTNSLDLNVVFVSLPMSILIGAILLANNIRDLDGDRENGRRTLAILLGKKRAVELLAGFFLTAFASIALIYTFVFPTVYILLVVFSYPFVQRAIVGFMEHSKPLEMMPAMKATAQANTFFGLLLGIAILLHVFIG
jgi:1,4-dihydroxy-2-naphthoate octaprenyltransferase